MAARALALLLLGGLGAGLVLPARADAPWEQAVQRARREQDRLLQGAEREAEQRNLVTLYRNRAMARATALNQYLLGRILYYTGREDEARAPMQEALRLDPGFWFAELGLAQLALRTRDLAAARQAINSVRSRRPADLNALKLDAHLCVAERRWPEAQRLLEAVLGQSPERPEQLALRRLLGEVAMELGQWETARTWIEAVRREAGDDPVLAWQHAVVLFELGEDEGVLQALARLEARAEKSLPVLNLRQAALLRLQRVPEWIATLREMEPLLPEGPERAEVRALLAQYDRGLRPTPPEPGFRRDPLAELLQRIQADPDPDRRREALQRYYDADLATLEASVLARYDPTVEPDPGCRMWVMRLLGRFGRDSATARTASQVATYLARALDDPASRVRRIAAEELGANGDPAATLYLLRALLAQPLDPLPADPGMRQALEVEFNAYRIALSRATRRPDLPASAGTWAPLEAAAGIQAGWAEWARAPEAVAPLCEALAALCGAEGRPELWCLSWASTFVVEPYPDPVALAAYRHIRAEVEALDPERRALRLLRDFPVHSDEDLAQGGAAPLRTAVREWWRRFLELRRATPPGAPQGPSPGLPPGSSPQPPPGAR